jgi:hypothetical protein
MKGSWRRSGFLRILWLSAALVEMSAMCEVRLLQSE